MTNWKKRYAAGMTLRRDLCVLTVVAIGLAGLGTQTLSASATPHAQSGPELVLACNNNGSIPQDFNPFVGSVYTNNFGATSLVYEPLIQFDVAAPPTYYPWLATKYEWSNNGKALIFTIRKNVKWSDGSPMTPTDVAFSYKLVNSNLALNSGGITLSGVSVSGDTVTLTFPRPQYTAFEEIANVPIVPKAIWSKIKDPATYAAADPIGTGPYTLQSFTPEGFTMVKNPLYWQPGKPAVDRVYFPAYSSNTSSANALLSGVADADTNYIPDLQRVFVARNPALHHLDMVQLGTVSLEPNLTTWPTNQLAVRKAISLAVDRASLNSEAESGYTVPVTDSSAMTLPTFKQWTDAATGVGQISVHPNPAAAKAVLEQAGFVMKNRHFYTKSGKELSLTLVDPAAYTDYAEAGGIIAQNLQAAGIDATFDGSSITGWASDLASGQFQLSLEWSASGITPYNEYEGWFNSALDGKVATGDFERLNNPTLDADLVKLASDATVSAQKAGLAPIQRFVSSELPIIPVFTKDANFEYSTANFVGWPTPSDPYEAMYSSPFAEVVVLHLSPRS